MDYYIVIESVLFYIENNLDQFLLLDFVVDIVNMLKYYFYRLFFVIIGFFLNNYIFFRRLNVLL